MHCSPKTIIWGNFNKISSDDTNTQRRPRTSCKDCTSSFNSPISILCSRDALSNWTYALSWQEKNKGNKKSGTCWLKYFLKTRNAWTHCAHTLSLSLSFFLSFSFFLSLSLSLSFSLSLSLSLSLNTHTHTHKQTHVGKHARTHTQTHAHTRKRTHAHTHTQTHVRKHARTHARTCKRRHTHTHARTHTHTHTHTRWVPNISKQRTRLPSASSRPQHVTAQAQQSCKRQKK